jgi:hypothetical protein
VPEHDGTVLIGVLVEPIAIALRANSFASLALRSPRGRGRRSSRSSKSKPNSSASVALCRLWSASNTATPSGPHTAASPSIVNDLARSVAAARVIARIDRSSHSPAE